VQAIPIAQFAGELLALYNTSKHAHKTRLKMRQALTALTELPGVETTADLRTKTMAEFVRRRGDSNPNTTNGLIDYLRAACSYAVEEGYLDRPPAWRRVRPRARATTLNRPCTFAEIARLVGYLRDHATTWEGRRLHALTCTVVCTGLRRDEALYARLSDVDLAAGTLAVREHVRRLKTLGSARAAPLPDALRDVLRDWIPHVEPGPWLFPGVRRRGPWTGGAPGHRAIDSLKRAATAVGIEGITWHGLRHTFGTQALLRFHVPLWAVQQIMGHAELRTTQRYLHTDGAARLLPAVRSIDYGSQV
jgi:integrase